MWVFQPTDVYEKRVEKWPKKHRRELKAMLDNLDTFVGALNKGAKQEHARFGFVHPEPGGVLAIDQKGGGAGLKQTRLYIFPEKRPQIIHLITLGDKDSQKADIRFATAFAEKYAEEEGSDKG